MFDIQFKKDLKSGNPLAFKKVFLLLYPRLKGYCHLYIKEIPVVEDIIQESFISLWENRQKIDPLQTIESYIFVMVRNRCINELKKKKLEKENFIPEVTEIEELQYLYQLDFISREEKPLEEMMVDSIKDAIDELPAKMKRVFVSNKIEGKKQVELAAEMGISLKMVEKHIATAKDKIREKLLKKYPALVLLLLFLFS